MTDILSLLDTRSDEREPLSEDAGMAIITCMMGELDKSKAPPIDDIKASFGYQVFQKRFQGQHEDFFTEMVGVFLSAAQMRSAGDAVLWAWTIHQMRQNSGKPVNMEALAFAFPMGFPTEDGKHRIWSAQKGSRGVGGNRLDEKTPWTLLYPDVEDEDLDDDLDDINGPALAILSAMNPDDAINSQHAEEMAEEREILEVIEASEPEEVEEEEAVEEED